MGLKIPPLPDDYAPGDDCLHCYPAGKTPNYCFVTFWDIVTCPGNWDPPNGMPFVCAQDPFVPCRYFGHLDWEGHHWHCYYYLREFFPGGSKATIQLSSPDFPQPLYYYERKDICSVSFSNSETACPGNGGEGGHAHVQVIVPTIIILLSSGYHFVTVPGLLYEIQEVAMDHQLVHLASRFDKTNVLIYIDEEDVVEE